MAIESMYKQTATTQRQEFMEESTIKRGFVNKLAEFPCAVQPLTPEVAAIMPGGFGKNWLMFCPVLDIIEGDKIIIDEDKEYRVSGVETYDYGINDHMEVTLTAFRQ